MNVRWNRWLTGALAFLVLYAVAGFWAVPWFAKRELATLAEARLHRRASVGELTFNPFTLRLRATDLRLSESDGAPIFAIASLTGDLQWRSLATAAWRLGEIDVTQPSANLTIGRDGRFNLAELADALRQGGDPQKEDSKLPRLVIERLAVKGGSVAFEDHQSGYANTLAPIDFELDDFSTLREEGDTHTFTAKSKQGGTLRWKGRATINPMQASGEIALENASLPELSVYLKSHARASIAAGRLSMTLPYELEYSSGKFDAKLVGARVALRDLALAREGKTTAFASLKQLDVSAIDADIFRHTVTVGDVRAEGARISVSRDGSGKLDIADLLVEPNTVVASAPRTVQESQTDWRAVVKRMEMGDVALLLTESGAGQQATSLGIERFGIENVSLEMAARRALLGRVFLEGANIPIVRDRHGAINLVSWMPVSAKPASTASAPAPWAISTTLVEAKRVDAELSDQETGVSVHVADAAARIEGASTDLAKPIKFEASFALREGGQVSAQGSIVPKAASVQAEVKAAKLELKPLQPMLSQYLKLKIGSGTFSAKGSLASGAATRDNAALRYVGEFSIANLALKELDDDTFGAWREVGAARMTLAFKPNRLDIPELRIVGADAKLVIEDDRSFNASRLLVTPPAPQVQVAKAATDDEPFPVRVRRVRVQDGKLDFTDLSLRPQFAAKIQDLNGVVNGLSSFRTARSQIELDGRVDEFGQARIRGELNPFVPRDNTDVNFVFRNVDMVPASPYSMKFAGYRIAEGKISLDLQYKVRDGQLEGDNKISIDRLTLGEKVESPDAIQIPLQLAIAILKDSDGRIDLGIPVSGDMNDPQFSYSAVVWKAVANVITKIVTAPFRALGSMLGVSGEKLEAITFDAGSAKLQPPEKEKLQQVAQILAKREGLRIAIPGQFSAAADGAALRTVAIREEVSRRAGIKLQPGEQAGPLDVADRSVRTALRELYAQRFGDAELDKAKKAAEAASPATASLAASASPAHAGQSLPIWQRVGKFIQGEPQVADATAFYANLRTRLEREQPLPADALSQLGILRAKAVAAALVESGVARERVTEEKAQAIESPAGRPVPLTLGLAAR